MIATDTKEIRFATTKQRSKIAQLCMALDIQERLEDKVITSGEAKDIIRELCVYIKVSREDGRRGNQHRSVYSYSNRSQKL